MFEDRESDKESGSESKPETIDEPRGRSLESLLTLTIIKPKKEIRRKGINPPNHPLTKVRYGSKSLPVSHTTVYGHGLYLEFEEGGGTCVRS